MLFFIYVDLSLSWIQSNSLGVDNDELAIETYEQIDKNPMKLHQTEIIALLALDLLNACQQIINPLTNQPFNVKFGRHIILFLEEHQ
jgi:hypothetical protein